MATEPPEIPHGMRRIYQRFADWRSAHSGVRLPIPPRLWKTAAENARKHGVGRTAQVLRLEYGKLKRLAESNPFPANLAAHGRRGVRRSAQPQRALATVPAMRARRTRSTTSPTSSPMFMELVRSPTIGMSECLIELEGPHGKMRVQWKGTTAPDLAGLSRALWEQT